jgi:hypothetical protein
MYALFRGFAAGVTFLGTFFFAYWMGGALLMVVGVPERMALIASVAISVTTAQAASRFVWSQAGSAGFLRAVALGAVLTGTVGFVLGFFGPLVFTPEANQGPLLGLFITGPLGALLGAIGGAVYWVWRRSRNIVALPTSSTG